MTAPDPLPSSFRDRVDPEVASALQQFVTRLNEWLRFLRGQWVDVPFIATNFLASAGTWTVFPRGHVVKLRRRAETVTVDFNLTGANVSTAGAVLQMLLPGGLVPAFTTYHPCRVSDAGAAVVWGLAIVIAGNSYVQIFSTPAGAGFTNTAAQNTSAQGAVTFEAR